jgi:hypothetical protein
LSEGHTLLMPRISKRLYLTGMLIAEKDIKVPASQLKKRSAVNTISLWSVRGIRRSLVVEECEKPD